MSQTAKKTAASSKENKPLASKKTNAKTTKKAATKKSASKVRIVMLSLWNRFLNRRLVHSPLLQPRLPK